MRSLVLVLLLLTGCVKAIKASNKALIISSTALIVCDWGQTRAMAERNWPNGSWEANPILGKSPTTGQVDWYFATSALLNGVLWYLMPWEGKWIVPTGVTGFQIDTVIGNHATTPGYCGRTWGSLGNKDYFYKDRM